MIINNSISILNDGIRIPIDYILDLCKPEPNDIVLVGGTLIEGMGNDESDLDIYVIVESYPIANKFNFSMYAEITGKDDTVVYESDSREDVHSLYEYYLDTKIHLDITFITLPEVQNLFSRIQIVHEKLLSDDNIYYLTHPLDLTYEENMFFHRLSTSLCLKNSSKFNQFLEQAPLQEYCLTSYAEYVIDYFTLKDVQGAIKSKRFEMARELVRCQLLRQVQATLYSLGITNRNEKWIFYYLSKMKDKFSTCPISLNEVLALPTSSEEDILYFIDKSCEIIDFCLMLARGENIFLKTDVNTIVSNLSNSFNLRYKSNHQISVESYQVRIAAYYESDLRTRDLIGLET
jgi:hypothetical protein